MKKKCFLLLILFLLITDLYSQKILIGKANVFKYSLIDRTNNTIYVYADDFYKKINLKDLSNENIPITIENEFEYENFTPLVVDSIHYFIHKQGGLVYQNKNDSIVRIDNSFNHLMQSNSSIFSYNSKIHRFGGYGFWSARNIITYYDNKLDEWEVINPLNSKVIPEESSKCLFVMTNDDLYVFNSQMTNLINRYELIFNEKLWNYNFVDKTWTHLGNIDVVEQTNFEPPFDSSINYGDKLLVNLPKKLIIIDIINNTREEYKKGISSLYIYKTFKAFFQNNRFYYFNVDDFGNLHLSIATESEMIGDKISSKPFYTNNRTFKIIVVISLIILTFVILVWYIRVWYIRSNKIQLLENGMKYRSNFIPMNSEAIQIIKLLTKVAAVNSVEILKFVEKEQFSRAHNERLKAQKINEINLKLKMLLRIKNDLIVSKKSNFDRRIREYCIKDKSYF